MGFRVHGIDIHAGSIAEAREKCRFANAQFEAVDLQDVDISKYDAVILSEVLEHIADADAFFEYLAAQIKPGALLILTVPNGWSLLEFACWPSYRLKTGTRWGG